jgi:hypothetical protein
MEKSKDIIDLRMIFLSPPWFQYMVQHPYTQMCSVKSQIWIISASVEVCTSENGKGGHHCRRFGS